MTEIIKHINDTNASYRSLGAGNAKNTDLFLDAEHYEMFQGEGEQITVRFRRENLTKAMLFIASILPRKYDNSSVHENIPFSTEFVYTQLAILNGFFSEKGNQLETRTQKWNLRKDIVKKNGEVDNRFYFNGLIEDITYSNHKNETVSAKFTIRNYLAGGYSDLHIKKADDGIFDVWITNTTEPYNDNKDNNISHYLSTEQKSISTESYLPYLTALRTKPFMLLAGISGTGKSRIVREMAKACWAADEEDYGKNCPRNFCMVQVKPNWHDSSDLIGYVSRINGEKYVVGPFLRFIAKAMQDSKRPYFLCLDEMNLAPVEQYFAEYLSVIESRKLQDGHIETDPIVPFENTEAYGSLIDQLFDSDEERKAYKTEEGGKRLTIPENLFVVGTVNMDETTFSFSRKVLDRAMTIEMNKVNLKGGLEAGGSKEFGYIGEDLMGDAAEGKDIYTNNQALCDEVITYLGKVNDILEGTPFKIAYRTRNEFLLYAVNRLHFASESKVWQTLDEMTSMKILSRIEGDNERCEHVLRELKNLLTETVGNHAEDSASLKKIDEMLAKLKSGYTSYWA